jgi:hypothetical protein
MKKLIIGSLVGGIILFIWQFLSWTVFNLHYSGNQYTPKQDAILKVLSSELDKDGQYYMPNLPPDATREQHEQAMKECIGKPYAVINYHQAMQMNMTTNMIHGLIVDILMAALFITLVTRMSNLNFTRVLVSSLFVGLIAFFSVPYTYHIWYTQWDLLAYFIDMLVSWGLCGVWIGYYYGKRKA